jgi:hypothetical protein
MGRRRRSHCLTKIVYDSNCVHREYRLDVKARIVSGLSNPPRRRARAQAQLTSSTPPPSTTVPAMLPIESPDPTSSDQVDIEDPYDTATDWD